MYAYTETQKFLVLLPHAPTSPSQAPSAAASPADITPNADAFSTEPQPAAKAHRSPSTGAVPGPFDKFFLKLAVHPPSAVKTPEKENCQRHQWYIGALLEAVTRCDETRPSCMRCIKAKRACGGYDDGAFCAFRQYEADGTYQLSPSKSIAQKCTLPKRAPIPGTDVMSQDAIPPEVSAAESNIFALRAFLYDFCVISDNRNLSGGYLSGLEPLAHRLGPKSDLVKACQAVAFASRGKPACRPQLVHKAEIFYQELLGSLARAIEGPDPANSTELKLVAMLLGLYQIAMTSETNSGDHIAHSKGLSALMEVGHSPLNLLGTVRPSHILDPTKYFQNNKAPGLFSVPTLSNQGESLDDLLLNLDLVWTKSEVLFDPKDFKALNRECVALDRRFSNWEDSLVLDFRPIAVAHISQSTYEPRDIAVGFWLGRIDTYFDLYVAGVWNIFRAARLLLLALIIKLSDAVGSSDSYDDDHIHLANSIAEDMAASVPYHLADNLQTFVSELGRSTEISDSGRLLGGLLLMHPLYVATKMPFLPEKMREYMRRCLLWIGYDMGLGQATLLAKV
ncbi:hypothetical protein AJ80_00063 [Polytolypa hystricis UAMH7299]|uniref:Zn(2)-C6 fungal-type domain-containing protein n=1 Tax=Polytolypa hystricis (strain UAMH7299) TaxID=1447883 RepID=A0A2B7Z4L3_POLH7|nr:hypothetical protein AJ80_00063 [Polytolypa hystricis UAMH7299]